jgi:hypothetical protein
MARISDYDRDKRAAYYLGKYLVKGAAVEFLTFGTRMEPPDDVRLIPSATAATSATSRP